ncbi:ExeA family protein [Agaribacterium haliotis]|uniref:ExeA family protein n=1 Tax=Agaribacterium haliotis TaxID=2013869 RepID=UPI000BB54E7F|nr:AAA family ATPase [Agaribacterium haliotis]
MYEAHFNFSEAPFSLTPDTQFFLNQSSHKDALNTILIALKHCEGFVKVVGEVGTGKTLLSRILLTHLKSSCVTAYVPNPYLSAEELKSFVAQEVGAQFDKTMASHELMSALYRRLVQLHRSGKQVVLIVDEAQAMPRDTVECLRLLTNLETEKRKLLQVVMLGQPELDNLLKRKDLRQLKQRIVFSEYLKPLRRGACRAYIQHRLASVDASSALFSSAAMDFVYLSSGGIPRLINILCHKALIVAYGRGQQRISLWHVAKAVRDTEESRARSWAGLLALFSPGREQLG